MADEDGIDREHLRKVFASISDDAARAFDRVNNSRRTMMLIHSCEQAGKAAHERRDFGATTEWYRIYRSLRAEFPAK